MALQVEQLLTNFIATNPTFESSLNAGVNDQNGYVDAYTLVNGYVTDNSGLRMLITLADGTVMMDTSKGDDNTYANFSNKSINENHNSRSAMMQALLSKSGHGFEEKYSTSTNMTETYQATRTGGTPQRANFLIRCSMSI